MVLDVLQSLFTPTNLAFLVGGVIIGIIFGAIPGLGANTAITLLLPVSFAMNATTAIIFMASIYCGGVSGGLISAIRLVFLERMQILPLFTMDTRWRKRAKRAKRLASVSFPA